METKRRKKSKYVSDCKNRRCQDTTIEAAWSSEEVKPGLLRRWNLVPTHFLREELANQGKGDNVFSACFISEKNSI